MATTAAPSAPPEGLSQRVSRLEGAYEHLATKADLAQLELRLAEKFGQLETKFGQLETKFSQLETKFSQLETRLYRSFWWMTVTLMAGIIAAISVATWVILSALPA